MFDISMLKKYEERQSERLGVKKTWFSYVEGKGNQGEEDVSAHPLSREQNVDHVVINAELNEQKVEISRGP